MALATSYALSQHSTPNRSARVGRPIYFVIHRMEGHYDYVVNEEFPSAKAQVSADECVSRDGKRVAVFNKASSGLKTWEVGDANSLCMGWEIDGFDGDEASLPDELFITLADRLVKAQGAVKRKYGVTIPLTHNPHKGHPGLVSHYDITQFAYGGTDHTDGKNFPWARLEAAIAKRQGTAPAPVAPVVAPTPTLVVTVDGKLARRIAYGKGRIAKFLAGPALPKLIKKGVVKLRRKP